MRAALLVAGLLALPALADPTVVSERPERVLLTVYHPGNTGGGNPREFDSIRGDDGIAFVTETRTVDVPAGPAVIELRGVTSTIVPQTAEVEGLPTAILERNFDYDLLSPGSLIQKSVGSTVTLVRTNPKTGKTSERSGVVKSGPKGVVLDYGNGEVEALQCSGLPEKLVFDRVPDGLRDRPTLSIRTHAEQAGRYTIKLHYIAAGLNWAADYVARVRPDGRSFDLTGWMTLVNGSDTGFENVPLDIVAGHLETDDDSRPVEAAKVYMQTGCWPTDVRWGRYGVSVVDSIKAEDIGRLPDRDNAEALQRVPSMDLETVVVTGFRASVDLGDYKLYSLGHPTDVLARQTKQIALLDQENVPFERFYWYAMDEDRGDWQRASVGLRFVNNKQSHLGLPLPGGHIAVSRDRVLLGRADFADTPVGVPAELALGEAQDVFVKMQAVSQEKIGGWFRRERTRGTGEIIVQNNKTVTVPFELYMVIEDGVELVGEPFAHVVKRQGMAWVFTLAPGETRTLRFVVEKTD